MDLESLRSISLRTLESKSSCSGLLSSVDPVSLLFSLLLLFSSSDNVSKLSNSSDEFFMSVSLTFFVVLSDSSIDIDFNKESRYSSSSVFAISSSDYLLNNLSSSDTS